VIDFGDNPRLAARQMVIERGNDQVQIGRQHDVAQL